MESPTLPGDKGDTTPTASHRSGTAGHRPTEIIALLGRGTHFEGKLYFDGRVRVDGSFRGEIRGEDVLVIGEGALVVGQIHVATCIVTGGEVEADIRARDAIELYAPSKVAGSLHAPAIFIDRGVQFDGTCKMAPLDDQPGEREAPRELPAKSPSPEARLPELSSQERKDFLSQPDNSGQEDT
jgi:cytoskeletal protein CcmA (bactofilin family)